MAIMDNIDGDLQKQINATNESLGTITNKFFVDTLTIADTSINAILDGVFRGAREKFGNNSYIADCIVNAGLSYHVTGYNVGGYGTFKAERYNGDGSISVWEATLVNNVWTAINEVPSLTKLNSDLDKLYSHKATVMVESFPYTAPSDGLLRLTVYKNTTTAWNVLIYVNSVWTGTYIGTTMPYHSQTFELRIKKGDEVNYSVESGGESFIGIYSEFVEN